MDYSLQLAIESIAFFAFLPASIALAGHAIRNRFRRDEQTLDFRDLPNGRKPE